ncbi:MAG TPA: protein adenylyltransferase SelO family protein, partial [Gammaproteobacteria bacterium]|nr:protein adenylyltransferase SelO family protein [Gammaproteobacteria bacterium]
LQDGTEPVVDLLREVVRRTAGLLAQWQTAGFSHGVMNTDNMSVLGLTLDYGPFGFMEAYEPGFICNHSDHHGRYAFDRQPRVALFNLSCFAQALLPLLDVEAAKAALQAFQPAYECRYDTLMAGKLGFSESDAGTRRLIQDLLQQMAESRADYTNTFRALCEVKRDVDTVTAALSDRFIDREHFRRWLQDYRVRLASHAGPDAGRQASMRRRNPKYILRNYLAQIAIDRATQAQDYTEIDRLFKLLQDPFAEQPEMERYAEPPPDWARNIQVSCSS